MCSGIFGALPELLFIGKHYFLNCNVATVYETHIVCLQADGGNSNYKNLTYIVFL